MLESFFKRFLRWSTTHWAIFFALCVVVLAVSIFSASQLQLRSSLKELLPERYQSVVQLNRMLDRVGGISVLTVTIESDNVEANKKFVDDLSQKVETLPRDEVRYVNSKVTPIREFYEKNILHFVDREDLKTLYTRLKRVIDYEKIKRSPLFLDLGEDPPPATLQFDDIKERNRKNVKMPLAVVDDYYGGEEGRFLIMMIRPQGAALAVDRARALIAKVKGMVVRPEQIAEIAKRHPELSRVRLVVTREAEQDAMTLHAETAGGEGLADAVAATLQSVTKLKGAVKLVAPGSLPNDGKVIADERPVS